MSFCDKQWRVQGFAVFFFQGVCDLAVLKDVLYSYQGGFKGVLGWLDAQQNVQSKKNLSSGGYIQFSDLKLEYKRYINIFLCTFKI